MPGIVFSESSGLNDSIYGKIQAPVQELIVSKAKSIEERESALKKLFKFTTSTHFAEAYTELTGMGDFAPTPENGSMNRSGMQEGHVKTLQNIAWTNEFAISRQMMDDVDVINLKDRPEAFIASYYATREKYAAALFGGALSGTASAAFKGWSIDCTSADGVCLFSAAHPSKVDPSYVQSNVCNNALTAAGLDLAETAMQNLRDDNGESLSIAPTTIVIPNTAAAKRAAFQAVGSDKDPLTANNAFNYQYGRWNIVVWQALNDYVSASGTSYPWFLLDEEYNQTYGTAIFQERTNLEIDSYEDKNTKANIWTGYSRFVAGFKDFRGVFAGGVTGAAALT